MKTPKLSVIIPVYNEQRHITSCLESLHKNTYPDFEIILVDDGSTDQTLSILKQFQSPNTLRIFRQSHQGPGAARNLGASKSRGEILVFVDADMTFDSNFLIRLIQPITTGHTIGTFTKDEHVANSTNPWARSWSLLRGFSADSMHPKNYPNTQPVFRAILKSEFNKAKGFDTRRGYDDDWSLSERLGIQAIHAPGAIIYHQNPDSLREIFTQSRWMAKRRYKFGILGKLVSLTRSSIPISLIIASYLSLKHTNPHLFFAKLTSDLGIFSGLLHLILTRDTGK